MQNIDPSVFDQILGRDEQIVECFKPNKKRYIWINIISTFIMFTLIFIIPVLFIVLGVVFNTISEPGERISLFMLIPVLAMFGFIVISSSLFNALSYKKTVYCYTNKRIIIRSGIVGVDYKTLEYSLIGGISVNVGLFDKLFRTNTGTISFASAAAMVQNSKGISPYAFRSIDDPYNLYKRIKEVYDNSKEND